MEPEAFAGDEFTIKALNSHVKYPKGQYIQKIPTSIYKSYLVKLLRMNFAFTGALTEISLQLFEAGIIDLYMSRLNQQAINCEPISNQAMTCKQLKIVLVLQLALHAIAFVVFVPDICVSRSHSWWKVL